MFSDGWFVTEAGVRAYRVPVPLHGVAGPRGARVHPPRPQVHTEVGQRQPTRRWTHHHTLQVGTVVLPLTTMGVGGLYWLFLCPLPLWGEYTLALVSLSQAPSLCHA